MTVKELQEELENYVKLGHADTRVIARCAFTFKGKEVDSFPLLYLDDVRYQSGDIELGFSDREAEE